MTSKAIFKAVSSSYWRCIVTALLVVAYSISLTALSLIVGIHVQTRGIDTAQLDDPNSIQSLCGPLATSGHCSGADLMSLSAVGGAIVSPVTAVVSALAVMTVVNLFNGIISARYRVQRADLPTSSTATSSFDRFVDRLGWLLFGPLAIWSIPALLSITVPAAAIGTVIVKAWPRDSMRTLVVTAAIGSAAVGALVSMIVCMLAFWANTCEMPLPELVNKEEETITARVSRSESQPPRYSTIIRHGDLALGRADRDEHPPAEGDNKV